MTTQAGSDDVCENCGLPKDEHWMVFRACNNFKPKEVEDDKT